MNKQPVILVTGATGAQGGSVARALLQQKKFAVRILTRNKNAGKAVALQKAGAEVAEGDFNDIGSMLIAMKDVYGVFGVTDYWEHFEKEYELGKNLIDAVHRSNVQHFVFSAQAHYKKISNDALPVPQYDIKAGLREYAKSLDLPATFIHVAFYYENFIKVYPMQKSAEAVVEFGFPQGDTPLASVSVEDVGGVVNTILHHPRQYIGRTVSVVGDEMPCSKYAAIMSQVLQQPVRYKYISRDEFAGCNLPAAEALANMFEVQRLYIPGQHIHLVESYGLNPQMQSFKDWMIKNKEHFQRFLEPVEETAV